MAEEQRVTRGQRLSSALKAPTINALLDVARAHRLGKLGPQGGDSPDAPLDGGLTVLLKNATGDFAEVGDVLAITGTPLDPEAVPLEFVGRPVFSGGVPAASTDIVAVMREGIEASEIGVGVVLGDAVVTLSVTSLTHKFAQPIAADSTKMASATTGFPVLWKATDLTTPAIGEQEAVVLLTGAGGGGADCTNGPLIAIPYAPCITRNELGYVIDVKFQSLYYRFPSCVQSVGSPICSPSVTNCCGTGSGASCFPWPAPLCMSLVGEGTCSCLDGEYILTAGVVPNGLGWRWTGNVCGRDTLIILECFGTEFLLYINSADPPGIGLTGAGAPISTLPFSMLMLVTSNASYPCSLGGGTLTATFTDGELCGSSGSGGGPGGCCDGICGTPGVPSVLTGTVTSKVGCFTTLPDTINFYCQDSGAGHTWDAIVVEDYCGNVGPSAWQIKCSTGDGNLFWIGTPDLPGIRDTVPESGFTCVPFSAVYLLNDNAGNSVTITVTE